MLPLHAIDLALHQRGHRLSAPVHYSLAPVLTPLVAAALLRWLLSRVSEVAAHVSETDLPLFGRVAVPASANRRVQSCPAPIAEASEAQRPVRLVLGLAPRRTLVENVRECPRARRWSSIGGGGRR